MHKKKKKVALSLKRRGSQKAKLSFTKPKLRDVCWKPSLELSVHLVGLSDLMSHLWPLPSRRVNHFSCFLTIWDNKRSSWKYYGSQPGARCGVRRGDLWITSFQELQISFWSLKKGEVGKVVYIKPHLWDLQPAGTALEVNQFSICSRLWRKSSCKLQGFKLLHVLSWWVLSDFSLEQVNVCLTQTFSAEVNAECSWLGNAAFAPMLW